jgi:hypothetical protein
MSNLISVKGGKVHYSYGKGIAADFPMCRPMAQATGAKFKATDAEVTCSNCLKLVPAAPVAEEVIETPAAEVTETETPAADSETLVTLAVMAPGSTSTKRETVSLPGGLSDWDAETTARRMLQDAGWNVMEVKEIRRR